MGTDFELRVGFLEKLEEDEFPCLDERMSIQICKPGDEFKLRLVQKILGDKSITLNDLDNDEHELWERVNNTKPTITSHTSGKDEECAKESVQSGFLDDIEMVKGLLKRKPEFLKIYSLEKIDYKEIKETVIEILKNLKKNFPKTKYDSWDLPLIYFEIDEMIEILESLNHEAGYPHLREMAIEMMKLFRDKYSEGKKVIVVPYAD